MSLGHSLGLVVLVGYILAAAYVVRDARRRGQSGVVWGLVALFVPFPFGFLLWFVVRRRLLPVPGE